MSKEWTLVAEYSADTNLVIACRQFDYLRIRYDIRRDSGSQEVWISDPEKLEQAINVLHLTISPDPQKHQQSGFNLMDQLSRFPTVFVTLALAIFGTLLVSFKFELVNVFTFQDYIIQGDSIGFYTAGEALAKGQYWRILSPVFLHFGIFHLAFNSLWLWELGRRIERLNGSVNTAFVFVLMGAGSNIIQYWWSGPSLFGGLSGVVYGLLGYLWIRHYLDGNPATKLPQGIIVFMLVWLVLGMTGVVGFFISGGVANAAHAGGLIIGMLLAIPDGLKGRSSLN